MKKAFTLTRHLLAITLLILAGEVSAAGNPVSGVSLLTALNDANALAAHRTDLKVLRVEGVSMLPFFGPGAVLVVKALPVEKLRAGMVVVYTNRFKETIAHRLLGRTSAGWSAAGYNNTEADSTPVNSTNLLGVVYATFHSNAKVDPVMLGAVNAGTPVALAAPAR